MTSSELRKSARGALKGKWGKAALFTLIYAIIVWLINFVLCFIPFVGSIIAAVVSLPISYGVLVTFMKLKRNEEFSYIDFLSLGFSNFGKVWTVLGNVILKLIIPIVLLVVFIILMAFGGAGAIVGAALNTASATASFSGIMVIGFIGYIASLIYLIIKGYLYSLSFCILYDNTDKTGKEIVEESEKLMKGNRWSFFWLGLTFIGWAILTLFTFGIGILWLMPYIVVTFVCFYEGLIGTNETVKVKTIENTEEE